MSITSLTRDWGFQPSIVRMTATNTLAEITTTGYVLAQLANIEAVNFGPFDWNATDYVLVNYVDSGPQYGFFVYDDATQSLTAAAVVPGSLSDTLPSADLFVGSAGNVATARALSGDATITNTGVLTIANLAVTTAKLAANAVTSAKLAANTLQYAAVAMTAAEFNGMYAAPKLLIAAGGANTLIVIERAVLAMTFVSAAYAAGGVVGLQYDATVHGAGVAATNTEAAADFFAAASTSFAFNGVAGDTVAIAPFTTTVNKGIYASNLTQAFTTGDGTWVVHLWYKVIPTV